LNVFALPRSHAETLKGRKRMKRILALLLTAVSVCLITCAAAQDVTIHGEDTAFFVKVTLPLGAQLKSSEMLDEYSMVTADFRADGKPLIIITTAIDEKYIGLSLSDLSREEVESIISTITVEMSEPETQLRTSDDGYDYIVANETTEKNDVSDTVMLVNGYFIMVHVYYEDFSELSEEDNEIGPDIMDTLSFIGFTNT